jgi:DNA helicase II / ATP-dependent DNA helicase PcrA
MADRRQFLNALAEMEENPEQLEAVREKGHCVVLAGPGSGKTKTLTTAMARCVLDDVKEPRGIACITYNNECAIELETRLARLGIEPSNRVFIGTVHSFALTQVILPYARCVMPEIRPTVRVATQIEIRNAVVSAHARAIGGGENPHDRWRFAEMKRRRDVDRTHPVWTGRNPELAQFIETYESELRLQGLIDFDDMPLLAVRMIREHEWIRGALRAKFPILFVDEYQDLGHALHELVLLWCFQAGVRLFAVGDPDQSIYAFTGANPELLESLIARPGVTPIRLRFNYRCGTNIIEAAQAALGEDRDYRAPDGAHPGNLFFHPVNGDLADQADLVVQQLIPAIQGRNIPLEEIAVLYRNAQQGNEVAQRAAGLALPVVRSDTQALVRRSSRLSRLIEACARWVSGGWVDADPPFRRLSDNASVLIYGGYASDVERQRVQQELITFLQSTIDAGLSTHNWLMALRSALIVRWRARARTITEDWEAIDEMIRRTDPTGGSDMPLAYFGGRVEGRGRLNLSTLHSAKGREFDAVILFAMNDGILPNRFDQRTPEQLREARRLFYVGVTRARKELHLVFTRGQHSPWVAELYRRTQRGT